uniref:AAA_12 domain-containing protein n=1 Tax=Caenorhabditis japonica TaxID=281687 RepID=A0A8R1EVL8_CAEJA
MHQSFCVTHAIENIALTIEAGFAVWKRHTTTPQPVAEVQSLRTGHKIPLVVFGITKMVLVKPQVLRRQGRGQLFAVVFVPEVQPCQLLRKVRSGTPKAEVLRRTTAVACQWYMNPVLLSFQPGHRDVIRDLDISPMSFSHGLEEDVETHAQALSTTFGVYGMVAMESKRTDMRYFHADLISVQTHGRRGTICQFLLHTEEQTAHSRLWRRGTPLSVELPNELLSETFHSGELVSIQPAVDSLFELRTLRLPYTHPLVVIHHNYPHRREDTSLVNEQEVEDALQYAAGLYAVREEPSIAILGFYKGSVEYAARRAPDYVQVLTVDSAQGREYDYVLVLTSRTSAGDQSAPAGNLLEGPPTGDLSLIAFHPRTSRHSLIVLAVSMTHTVSYQPISKGGSG